MSADGAQVIWMPFAYRARVGGRRVLLAARIPVAPQEVSWAEAPIAATVGDEVFRHRDGAWLRPVRLPSGDVAKVDGMVRVLGAPPRNAVAWADYPLFDPAAGLPVLPFADGVAFEDALPAGHPQVRGSERGIREGRARAAAASLVVMRGVLWRICPEPHLTVRAEGRGLSGRISVGTALRPDPSVDAAYFRLDERDSARTYAETLAAEHVKDAPRCIAVDVRIPGAVRFDPERAMADRIAFELASSRRRTWLDPAELAHSRAGVEMRRILAAVDLHVEGADPLPVLAATAAFLQSPRGGGRYGAFLRRGLFQVMERQLLAWARGREETLATTAEDDAAIAGLGPSI